MTAGQAAHRRARMRVYLASRRAKLIAEGKCIDCGKNPSRKALGASKGQTCEACGRKKAKKAKESQRRKRPHWRSLGICQVCGKRKAIEGQSWCGVCAERHCTRKSRA